MCATCSVLELMLADADEKSEKVQEAGSELDHKLPPDDEPGTRVQSDSWLLGTSGADAALRLTPSRAAAAGALKVCRHCGERVYDMAYARDESRVRCR